MKIFSITIVQNQVDIIEDVIRHHQPLFDDLYIWDIGSSDGTLEVLELLSEEFDNIFLKKKTALFADDLRGVYFNEIKYKYTSDDWYYQLDSDEFVKNDVRKTIKLSRLFGATFIKTFHLNFRYTKDDYDKDVRTYKDVRHYKLDYSEVRAFKNRQNLSWPIGERSVLPIGYIVPINLGIPSIFFLKVFHFPFRSKRQIEKRMKEKIKIVEGNAYEEVKGIRYDKYRHTKIEGLLGNAEDCKVIKNFELPYFSFKERIYIFNNFLLNPYLKVIAKKVKALFK